MTGPMEESKRMKAPIRIVTVFILVVVVMIGVLLYERMSAGSENALDRTPPISSTQQEEPDGEEEIIKEENQSEPDEDDLQNRIGLRKNAPIQ